MKVAVEEGTTVSVLQWTYFVYCRNNSEKRIILFLTVQYMTVNRICDKPISKMCLSNAEAVWEDSRFTSLQSKTYES